MATVKKVLESYERTGSYRRTAREMGIAHNTVRKYVLRAQAAREGVIEEIVPRDREIHQPSRVVTPEIRGMIHRILEKNRKKPKKQRCNAKLIWQYLLASGYLLSYSTVKREVARWHAEQGYREVFIAQETDEGQRAEFDFGKVQLTLDSVPEMIPQASFVLNHSLYRFALLTPRETLMDIIHAHIAFFHDIGGVPETIFYDNPRTIILDSNTATWNPKFLAFAAHYGFTPHTCTVRAPHEKGSIEQSVKYVRQSAFARRSEFPSFDAANQYLKETLRAINGAPVYRRPLTPHAGLAEEQKTLKPLPTLDFSNYSMITARISKYSTVTFETNKYSVPERYPGRTATMKIFADRIELIANDEVVATHRRIYGRKQYSLDICHYLETFEYKPGSLANALVFKRLHASIQQLYHDHYRDNPREFLPLLCLLKEHSARDLVAAIEVLTTQGLLPTRDLVHCILTHHPLPGGEPRVFRELDITVDPPDLKAFDRLMEA